MTNDFFSEGGRRSPAIVVRELLSAAGLSQRQGAHELDISERTMRYYCSGEQAVPKVVILARQVQA